MFRHRFHRFVLLIAASLTVLEGCNYPRPRLFDFRPTAQQRYQLQRFDPYPDNDIGPAMVGVRPPGFQDQVVEPARSRWHQAPAMGVAPY